MSTQPFNAISRARFVVGLIAALALTPSLAHAANATWSGATSGNWSVTTNWSANPVPGTGDTATFNAASSNTVLDLGSGVTISTLLFDTANAAAYTIGSGGAGNQILTLNNSGAITRESTVTNNELINANLTLGTATAGTYTVTNNGTTGTITLAGNITGAVGGSKTLNIRGNGTTNISGNVSLGSATGLTLNIIAHSNSTISGRITGAVVVTQSATTATTTGSLTLNNDANDFTGQFSALGAYGSKVFFTSIADFGTASALGKGTAGSTISLSGGYMVYTGTASSSSNRTWSGVNSNAIENNSATGVLNLSGNFAQSTANGTFTLRGSNTGNNTFGGSISAAASGAGSLLNLTKSDAGTWILSGNNSYTGVTTVNTNAGTLQFAKTASLYNGSNASWTAANINVKSGGTLAFNVGGTGEFSTGDVTTLLTNLGGANGGTSTGFASGSNIGFDTTNASGSSFTIADIIANSTGSGGGAIGVTKRGSGTLILTGANTYTGATTVGTSGGANAGTLQLSGVGKISNNATTIFGGTLDLNGTNQSITTLSMGGGASGSTAAVTTGSGTLTLGGNITFSATNNASGASISGNLDLGGATRTFTIGDSSAAASDLTVGAAISNGTLTKDGAGTLLLSGANTYTGATTVSAGVLNIQHANALGTTAGNTTVSSGAALQLQGSITVGAEALSLTGTGVSTDGALRNISGSNTYGGAITLAGATRINSDADLLTLSGSISGTQNLTIGGAGNTTINSAIATSTGTLTKDGLGTLVLSGANSYTGATTIAAGTLQIGAGSTTGNISSSSAITNNGTLVINRSDAITISNNITGTGNLTKSGAGTVTLSGANDYTGTTTVSAGVLTINSTSSLPGLSTNGRYSVANGATLAVSNAVIDADIASMLVTTNFAAGAAIGFDTTASRTYSSNITDTSQGALGLTKLGSNTLTLFGNNSYTGTTTINAGILAINGNSTTTLSGLITGAGQLRQSLGTIAGSLTINNDANDFTGQFSAQGANSAKVFFTSIADYGTASALGKGTAGTTISLSNGWLVYTGAASSSSNRTWSGVNSSHIENNSATGVLTLSGDFAQSTANGTFNLRGSNTGANTFAGSISVAASGAGSLLNLAKVDAGRWILSGNNSYTGTTTVSGGILQFAKTASLYNGTTSDWTAANIRVSSGGTLAFNVGGTGEFSTADVTTLLTNLTASSSSTNGMNSGSILGFDTTNAGSSFTIGNTIANTTGASGGARGLTKLGTGTLILTGANTYTGNTTVGISGGANAGTLQLSGVGKISTAATTIFGGTLDLNGTNQSITTLSMGGGASGSTAAVTTGSGTLTLGGNVTFSATNNASGASITGNLDLGGATRTFTVGDSSAAASDLTVGAAISNGTLTKDGAGTLSLSGINTYTGTTTVNAGNLTLTGGSAISDSGAVTLTNAAGAILHVAQSETIGNLSGGGASGGNISIASGQTLTVNQTSAGTFAGIISGSGGLTKNGSSSLTLSNTNTYQGATTINAGTINLSGSNTASTTAINSGGTLIGTGSAGVVTVNSSGGIGAGSAALTAGTLTVGTLTLNGGSTYSWDLGNANGSTAGTDWDVLNVTGALTLNATAGNQITIALGGTAAPSTSKSWNIINYGSLPNTWDSSVFNITNNIAGSSGTWSLTNNSTFIGLTYTLSSTSTWAGGAGNWSSGFSTTPANGNALVFSGAGGTATNNIASGSLTSLTTITINSTAGSYTLAANSGSLGFDAATPLTITGVTNNSANATTVNLALAVNSSALAINAAAGNITMGGPISNNNAINFSGANSTTVSGAISGTGAINKDGNGTLTLTGSNSYNGTTTINAGVLNIRHNNALGSTAGGAVVGNGTALQLQNDITITGEALTLSGAGNGGNTGALRSISGSNIWAGDITNGAASRIASDADLLTISGNINNAGFQNNFQGNGNITVSGIISGSGAVTLSSLFAANSVLTLSGNNTFTGQMQINRATLSVSSIKDFGVASGLGNGTSGTAITIGQTTSNGALLYTGAGDTSNRTIQIGTNSGTPAASDTGSATIQNDGSGALVFNATNFNTALNASSGVGANRTLTLSGSNTGSNTISGVIRDNTLSGSATGTATIGLIKSGAGTWVLSGNNTYTGATTINLGTLQIGAGGTSGALSPSSTLTNNGALVFNRSNTITQGTDFANSISGTGNLTQAGTGTLVLAGTNSYTGATTISAGNISISSTSAIGSTSGVNLANATSLIYTGSAATLDRAITVTAGTGTITNSGAGLLTLSGALSKNGTTLTLAGGSNGITVSGVISGSANNSDLVIDGGTTTLTNANNSYNGPTFIINGATLNANAVGALPISTLSALTINGSSTLVLGASQSVASLSGTSGATVSLGSNTFTINGSTTTTYNGGISGTGGLIKTGSGTQVLSGTNTYTGGTTISAGNLTISGGAALADNGTVTLANASGAVLSVSASETIGSLSGGGSSGGNIVIGSGQTLTVNQSTDTTFSGAISGANLVKTGSGNLTLNGTNTLSGTITINTGTLIAGAAGALGLTSNITVNNGGSLFVAANDAFATSANVTLNGTSATLPTLQFSGNYNGSISSLTLTGNSIIDLGTGSVVIDLGIIKGLQTYSLKIYNWSGNTLWSGGYGGGTDQIYTSGNKSLTTPELANISFYTSSFSSGLTSGFTGSGFQNSINGEIFGVPEPSTYVLCLLLLGGMGVYYLRKRVFSFQSFKRSKLSVKR